MITYFVVAGTVVVVGVAASVFVAAKSLDEWDFPGISVTGFLLAIGFLICGIFVVVIGFRALAAETRANVLTKNLGISFTAEEIFWAGSDIEKLYYGDLRRFNINIDNETLEGMKNQEAE